MITKTYLEGRLSDLEQSLEKKIDFKVGQAVQRRESEIAKLKNDIKELTEKMNENRDIDENRDDTDTRIISEIELLRERIEKMERSATDKTGVPEENNNAEGKKIDPDTITPDEM